MIVDGHTDAASKAFDQSSPLTNAASVEQVPAEGDLLISDSESSGGFVGLTDAVLAAQREADEIADNAENKNEDVIDENALFLPCQSSWLCHRRTWPTRRGI